MQSGCKAATTKQPFHSDLTILSGCFQVCAGKWDAAHSLMEKICNHFGRSEAACLWYEFSTSDSQVTLMNAYTDAAAVEAHMQLARTSGLLEGNASTLELVGYELHGPKEELDKLEEHFKPLKARFFYIQKGLHVPR